LHRRLVPKRVRIFARPEQCLNFFARDRIGTSTGKVGRTLSRVGATQGFGKISFKEGLGMEVSLVW